MVFLWVGHSTVCNSSVCRGRHGKWTVWPYNRWAWTWSEGSLMTKDVDHLWCTSWAHVLPMSAALELDRKVPVVVYPYILCNRRSSCADNRTICCTEAWSVGPSVWRSCACPFLRSTVPLKATKEYKNW